MSRIDHSTNAVRVERHCIEQSLVIDVQADIAARLVALFKLRFDPDASADSSSEDAQVSAIETGLCVTGGAVGRHGHLHVSGKIDKALDELGEGGD